MSLEPSSTSAITSAIYQYPDEVYEPNDPAVTMAGSLDDPFPELEEILNKWVEEGKSEKSRVDARSKIIDFLRDSGKTELVLAGLGLTSLPDVFGKQPLVSKVISLNLSNNYLTLLPEQIGLLENLTHLNLSNNQLRSIPMSIGLLEYLTHLNLSNNQFKWLPIQINQLETLTHLNLSNNQFISFQEPIDLPQNLTDLDLSNNQFTSISEEIDQFKHLTMLDLSGNSKLESLPNDLANLSKRCRIYAEGTGLPEHVLRKLQLT